MRNWRASPSSFAARRSLKRRASSCALFQARAVMFAPAGAGGRRFASEAQALQWGLQLGLAFRLVTAFRLPRRRRVKTRLSRSETLTNGAYVTHSSSESRAVDFAASGGFCCLCRSKPDASSERRRVLRRHPRARAWLPDIQPAHLTQKCLAQQLGHFSPVVPVQGPETLDNSARASAVP